MDDERLDDIEHALSSALVPVQRMTALALVAEVRRLRAELDRYRSIGSAALAAENLVALSKWIDAGNVHRDPEAVTWGRIAKIAEEHGEVIQAFIGATGQNPRKGVVGSMADVEKELLDVAITALGALEHFRGHDGTALASLNYAIHEVARRAGVA
jgi:hypothetical protein